MPIKLYRFQPKPIEKHVDRLDMLRSDQLYVSDPKSFNDPIDMKIEIRDHTNRWSSNKNLQENIRKAFSILISDKSAFSEAKLFDDALIEKFQTWIDGGMLDELDGIATAIKCRLSEFGIVCLTQHYRNRLLWAHYADMGEGFCIEYEVTPLNNPADLRYVPVQYVSEIPELCVTEAMFSPHQFLYKYAASKHLDWSYEREVRLLSLSAKGRQIDIHPNFLKLTGLIGGYQMSETTLDHLVKTAKRLNIGAFQLGSDLSRENALVELFKPCQ